MKHSKLLSHMEAKRFYDRLGSALDTQSFYEKPALHELQRHLDLEHSHRMFEFGCGTGRLAAEMLEQRLPPDARYVGVDVSETMVAVAQKRLGKLGERAAVSLSNGAPEIAANDASFDRFICTYVLDLLAEDDIAAVLREAHRILAPGGLLGLVSLTNGMSPLSRLVSVAWSRIHRMSPWLVGGCRPISLISYLAPSEWTVRHTQIVVSYSVPSEIVVAERAA